MATLAPRSRADGDRQGSDDKKTAGQPWASTDLARLCRDSHWRNRVQLQDGRGIVHGSPAGALQPGGVVSAERFMPYYVESVMTVNKTRDTIVPCAARKSDVRRQTFEASQPEQFE
jgi:hypothetical protein